MYGGQRQGRANTWYGRSHDPLKSCQALFRGRNEALWRNEALVTLEIILAVLEALVQFNSMRLLNCRRFLKTLLMFFNVILRSALIYKLQASGFLQESHKTDCLPACSCLHLTIRTRLNAPEGTGALSSSLHWAPLGSTSQLGHH